VSPERDEPIEDQEHELYEDVPPRSIFAAAWFRVVLVVIVLGVVGAVAVPYVLDWMNPPPLPRTAATTKSSPAPAPTTPGMAPVVDKPIDKPFADRPPSDKLVADSTGVPAPAPSTPTPPPARAETKKSEPRPSPAAPSAKPAAEAKAVVPEPKRMSPVADAKTSSQSAMAVTDAPKPAATAKPGAAKAEATAKDETTQATATKPTTTKRAVAKAPASAPAVPGGAPYWVQIGAFKDPETAKRIAAKLREENFKVEESIKRVGGTVEPAATAAAKTPTPAPAGADQYDVFVTGMSVEELNRRLAGKGLAGDASGGGVVVKPSQPLRDAVALSKDLAVEGFKVQVRRAGGSTAPAVVSAPTTPAPAPVEGGQQLHRVRVGAFTDRAAAQAAARELESKGFKPYIARGDQ
jgi:cell division septation protein DedD